MATNRVFVRYSETYDMNTVQDKLSVIGIHTPTNRSLYNMARGLFLNFSKYKIHGCDIAIACASQMPVDPLGVGTEPGMVAPQDLMNPMLFKACTGEALNTFLDSIYDQANLGNLSVDELRMARSSNERWDPLQAYYTLLADETWRKAIPQMGMVINNLKPLVHDLATIRPMRWDTEGSKLMVTSATNPNDIMAEVTVEGDNVLDAPNGLVLQGSLYDMASKFEEPGEFARVAQPVQFISTGARPLPALDTISLVRTSATPDPTIIPVIPKVYCGVLVMPPAVLQSLYFRVRITWRIEFIGFRPYFEGLDPNNITAVSDTFYRDLLTPAGSGDVAVANAMQKTNGSLDGIGLDSLEVVNASLR